MYHVPVLEPLSSRADQEGFAALSGLSDNSPVPVEAVLRVLVLESHYTISVYPDVSSNTELHRGPLLPITRGMRPVLRPAYIRVRVRCPYLWLVAASSARSPSLGRGECLAILSCLRADFFSVFTARVWLLSFGGTFGSTKVLHVLSGSIAFLCGRSWVYFTLGFKGPFSIAGSIDSSDIVSLVSIGLFGLAPSFQVD